MLSHSTPNKNPSKSQMKLSEIRSQYLKLKKKKTINGGFSRLSTSRNYNLESRGKLEGTSSKEGKEKKTSKIRHVTLSHLLFGISL